MSQLIPNGSRFSSDGFPNILTIKHREIARGCPDLLVLSFNFVKILVLSYHKLNFSFIAPFVLNVVTVTNFAVGLSFQFRTLSKFKF